MRTIGSGDRAEVLQFLRQWVGLLAQGAFDEAISWLTEDSGHRDPTSLKETIYAYSPEYRDVRKKHKMQHVPRIENPSDMDEVGEELYIYELEKRDRHGRQAMVVEYFLPLDGKWSDLRASFMLKETPEARYSFRLDDISVP